MPRIRPIIWLKAHPYVADAILAALIAVSQVASHLWGDYDAYPRSTASVGGAIVAALVAVPIVWRRRYPYHVLAATTALLVLAEVTNTQTNGWTSCLVAVYTIGAHRRGRRRTWAAAAFVAVNILGFATAWMRDTFKLEDLVSSIIVFSIAYVTGDNLQRRRQAVADLAERAERAEREQELLAREQVRDERTRIARELHDVVAHSLSVMVIQAAAARRQLPSDPDRATEALVAIEATGREAMDEMRRVLGVLRGNREPGADLAPQPSLGDLPDLIAASPDLPVHLRTQGTFAALTPGVELSAYRVVQEALTNIRRHAGTVTVVDVWLRCDDRGLDVEVTDDGRRTWPDPPPEPAPELRSRGVGLAVRDDVRDTPAEVRRSGFGLIGMRERVSAFGGEFEAGPRPGGGWSVRAHFPAVNR